MELAYQCPSCRAGVSLADRQYPCDSCGSTYPVVCGIPDFRIFPDPYIDVEEDREKAIQLDAHAQNLSLRELIELYFSITPEVPPELASRYLEGMLVTSPARAQLDLEALATSAPQTREARGLDIGCGSGPYLAALAERHDWVTGADIALRWLVIARRRLAEQGLHAELVCCCGEALPFADGSFDRVVVANAIEHSRAPARLLEEVHRTLDAGGIGIISTPNRISPRRDPHFGIWGLGLMPRSIGMRIGRWLRGVSGAQIRLLDIFELHALLDEAGFRRVQRVVPDLPADPPDRPSTAIRIYRSPREGAVTRWILHLVGPVLMAIVFKGPNREARALGDPE